MSSPLQIERVRRLYPNTFSFAAGNPPQRGGSRASFDALSFERKTILLPPPYTFALSRIPASRVSDTYLETFGFAQTPDEGEEEPQTAYAYRPRE